MCIVRLRLRRACASSTAATRRGVGGELCNACKHIGKAGLRLDILSLAVPMSADDDSAMALARSWLRQSLAGRAISQAKVAHQWSAALLASAGARFGAESVDLGLDIEQDIEALHRLQCNRV